MPREVRLETDLPPEVQARRAKEQARRVAVLALKTATSLPDLKAALLVIFNVS